MAEFWMEKSFVIFLSDAPFARCRTVKRKKLDISRTRRRIEKWLRTFLFRIAPSSQSHQFLTSLFGHPIYPHNALYPVVLLTMPPAKNSPACIYRPMATPLSIVLIPFIWFFVTILDPFVHSFLYHSAVSRLRYQQLLSKHLTLTRNEKTVDWTAFWSDSLQF